MSPHTHARTLITFLLATLLLANAAHATTRYVNGTCGNDAWQGLDETCASPTGPYRTIGRAILAAVNGDTILVAPGTYNESINFAGKTITLTSTGGRDVTTIDGSGIDESTILMIGSEGTATTLDGFTVTGGSGHFLSFNTRGGGLYINGRSPTIRNCRFTANEAAVGGAIRVNGGRPQFIDCLIDNNQSTSSAGGVSNYTSPNTPPFEQFVRCQFIDNTTDGFGGALVVSGSSGQEGAYIVDCVFEGNIAGQTGGAVHRSNGFFVFTRCSFDNNHAGLGGAFYSQQLYWNNALALSDCTFSANTASGGGAIYFLTNEEPAPDYSSTTVLSNCSFSDNSALVAGGAAFLDSYEVKFVDCLFEENSVDPFLGNGGAVYMYRSNPQIIECEFSRNTAGNGGAVCCEQQSLPTISDCRFLQNDGSLGGAVHCAFASNANVSDSYFFGNSGYKGVAAYSYRSAATYFACEFKDNIAGNDEAIHALDSNIWVNGCDFLNTGAVPKSAAIRSEGTSTPHVSQCTFSGHSLGIGVDRNTSFIVEDSSFHLCTIGGAIASSVNTNGIVRGCMFVGNGSGSGSGAISGSNYLIQDCTFEGNTGQSGYGGGLALNGIYEGTVQMERCEFRNHAAFYNNGVVRSFRTLHLKDCHFENNDSFDIAMKDGSVVGCTFSDGLLPVSISSGGEVLIEYCTFSSSQNNDIETDSGVDAIIRHCSFGDSVFGNFTTYLGSDIYIANCIFDGSGRAIGGFHSNRVTVDVSNCLFRNKDVVFRNLDGDDNVLRVRNCTFANNALVFDNSQYLEDSEILALNCIFHQSPLLKLDDEQFHINYSLITDGWPGVGNISGQPSFIDASNGDYRLKAGSACIDAGFNNAVGFDFADLDNDGDTEEFVPVDLDGNPRFRDRLASPDSGCGVGRIVDMGAYERQQGPANQPTFADIDGDSVVAGFDLAQLLGAWGDCMGACCLADLNADGAVNGDDLALLLGAWTVD